MFDKSLILFVFRGMCLFELVTCDRNWLGKTYVGISKDNFEDFPKCLRFFFQSLLLLQSKTFGYTKLELGYKIKEN